MSILIEVRPSEGGDDAAVFAGELASALRSYARRCDVASTEATDASRTIRLTFDAKPSRLSLDRFAGTHRIQRIPANDRKGRRHTSTATVAVLSGDAPPEVTFDPDEVSLDFFSGSGPGGQHRNKSQNCVRATHIPSGITVSATRQRSKNQNIAEAMTELASRLRGACETSAAESTNEARVAQVASGDRPAKTWTWNDQRSEVVDHSTGQKWPMKAFLRGRLGN